MKPTQEQIAAAAYRGIVGGAKIANAYKRGRTSELVLGPTSEWEAERNGDITYGDLLQTIWIYDNHDNRWATVITPAPSKEEGLKEGDAVECGPAMRAALKELAKELRLEYTSTRDGSENIGMAVSYNGTIVHAGMIKGDDTKHTLEAFIAKMRVTAAKPKPIEIGEHTVEFIANGDIKVGCTSVDFATIEAVYNRAKEQRNAPKPEDPVKLR